MDVRIGILLLMVLGATGTSSARQPPRNLEALKQRPGDVRNNKVCALCEEYASMALDYLAENKTQKEIIALLDISCSQLHSFKSECVALVNHYAPLFFAEIGSVQPVEFCQKINLCKKVSMITSKIKGDGCELCRDIVSEIMNELEDPDTQMDIIQLLLKGCNFMQNYVKKCKRMVFEYGPLLIDNIEDFLYKTDICAALHACSASSTMAKHSTPNQRVWPALSASV